MRHVPRNNKSVPPVLTGRTANLYLRDVERYLVLGTTEFRPTSPPDYIVRDKELRLRLVEMFDFCCAYCETPVDSHSSNVDHFRPWAGADRGNGAVDYRHYCWLALDWGNLYPACDACVQAKRNFFPIRGASDIGVPRAALAASEGALLLDPCRDYPPEHLSILEDGVLAPLSDEGRITIEILQLNRPALVAGRRRTLAQLHGILNESAGLPGPAASDRVGSFFADRPDFRGSLFIALLQRLPPGHSLRRWVREPINPGRAAHLAEAGTDQRADISVPTFTGPRLRLTERRYIRRVVIDNFRGVRHAVVEFPRHGKAGGKSPGSLVILGENGAGKTSILQATAIGGMGPTYAHEAGIKPRDCLQDGARQGKVAIQFWDTDDTNLVTFRRDQDFFGGHRAVPTTVLGYGAYRLPAKRPLGSQKTRDDYRVQSLFDERELVNGTFGLQRHFRGRGARARIEDATRALNALLTGSAKARISSRTRIVIEEAGRPQRLVNLSSGFKSVVSVACDLMDVMYRSWGGMSSAQALILVDEIDAHLHPEWRLKVIDALRNAFPLSQLMLTTHDPLVLRGLAKQEIRLLARGDGGGSEVSEPQVPDTDGLTVDQMLTSDLFGLRTTMEEQTARDLGQYYTLLAQPSLSPDGQAVRDALRDRLRFQQPMGNTRRERLLYAVIDRYLARSDPEDPPDIWDREAVEELVVAFEALESESDRDDPA